MTELAIIEPDEMDFFSEEESSSIRQEIDTLLDAIHGHEHRLATSYVQLGRKLLRVQQGKYWQEWGYSSIASYYGEVGERIGRQRSQVYAYVSVAERLLPSVSESALEHMGISRAQELARFVKQTGKAVPQHLLDTALNPKTNLSKLHVEVLEALHEKCDPKGTWWDFGGFYADEGERKELQDAIARARAEVDPTLPEHVQRKHILLAWGREFLSSNPTE